MKTKTFLLCLAAYFCGGTGALHAQQQPSSSLRWTRPNIVAAGFATGLIATDCRLTLVGLKHNSNTYETNALLGRRPSSGTINAMCGLAVLGNIFIAHNLPAKYRKWWFLSVGLVESYAVIHNIRQL